MCDSCDTKCSNRAIEDMYKSFIKTKNKSINMLQGHLSERKEEIMHLREKVHLAGEELAQKDPELARREALLDQQIEGLRRDLERQRESERIMKEIMLDVEENI